MSQMRFITDKAPFLNFPGGRSLPVIDTYMVFNVKKRRLAHLMLALVSVEGRNKQAASSLFHQNCLGGLGPLNRHDFFQQ